MGRNERTRASLQTMSSESLLLPILSDADDHESASWGEDGEERADGDERAKNEYGLCRCCCVPGGMRALSRELADSVWVRALVLLLVLADLVCLVLELVTA
jgi:hypothetical protein